MKLYVELGLAALLAVLVYEKPNFLINTVNTTLGKIIMIVTVGLLAKQFGLNAGLLAAIIMVLLLDTHKEIFEPNQKNMHRGEKLPNTIGKDVGEDCSTSKDCGPCEKLCRKTKNELGKPKACACNSSCSSLTGKCVASCAEGECSEGYTNINNALQPSSFPVTGTDQIGLSRMLKINALQSKMSASQQANGCTNNGGGIAF